VHCDGVVAILSFHGCAGNVEATGSFVYGLMSSNLQIDPPFTSHYRYMRSTRQAVLREQGR